MDHLSTEKLNAVLQEIDLVVLQQDLTSPDEHKLSATRAIIIKVFQDFLKTRDISVEQIEIIDGFFFLFNEPKFFQWHTLNWWEQRQHIRAIKEHQPYQERAQLLLQRSYLAPYVNYSDEMVAKSDDPVVKHAWMRKRLVLRESFWNTIDSVSHAAYFQKKYQDIFPAFCLLLCNITGWNGKSSELLLGIDNGIGYLYKKKSRDSAMLRLLYKGYKYFFRSGVFYIGGLELGLMETDSELSCHGAGAVVFQGW